MIKDLLNIELKDVAANGLQIHIVKKYVVKTRSRESFSVTNFSILLIKSGKFKIRFEENIKELSAQDLVVMPKNSFCTLLEVPDKPQFFLLSFTSEFAFQDCFKNELVNALYFLTAKTSISIRLDGKDFFVLSLIYKLICSVNKEVKIHDLERELQRISFNLFLHELRYIYAKYGVGTLLNFSRKESLTIQFLTVLAIHCKKQHSASFYAGSLFVTTGYLNKIVKQVTSKPVKILIVDAIIAEAKSMLEDSQFPISVIAEELEFSNASSFSVFFKRYTSFTPSEYRSNTIERSKNR